MRLVSSLLRKIVDFFYLLNSDGNGDPCASLAYTRTRRKNKKEKERRENTGYYYCTLRTWGQRVRGFYDAVVVVRVPLTWTREECLSWRRARFFLLFYLFRNDSIINAYFLWIFDNNFYVLIIAVFLTKSICNS